MSEHQPKSHNHEPHAVEAHEAQQHIDRLKNKVEQEAREADQGNSERLETAHQDVEKLAQPIEQHRIKENNEAQRNSNQTLGNTKVEQQISFSRTMTRVRKRLNAAERPLSKIIHNKTIDKVSEVSSKTVARPSSMLGGAFFSLIGTSALLWITKHYGYEYNYLMVIALFAIGMVVGVALEFAIRSKNLFR